MRRIRLCLTAAALLLLAACASGRGAAGGGGGGADRPGVTGTPAPRAQEGETVYFSEFHVRPESRLQFVDFIENTIFPAYQRAGRGTVVRSMRLLHPSAANEDGSFTFTMLLDPVVPGETYNWAELLRQGRSEEEAYADYGRFTMMWAKDFTSRAFVQGKRFQAP